MPFILGRQRWACACPAKRASITTNRKNRDFLILLHFEFVNLPCTHKVFVLHNEGLMSPSVLLVHLHNELFIIGDGELLKREYRATALLSRHIGNIVVGRQRKQYLLLHGGLLGNLLIHDFERDEVNVERHVGSVAQFGVEVQQPVVRVEASKQILNAEPCCRCA